ncbi:MAG: hypothetical protein O3C19_01925 [Bacteroidetes bacterium]|nr:hypothetical protein [Bacteroidota bacterium]
MIKLEQIINEANPDRDKMYRKLAVSTFNKLLRYIKSKGVDAFEYAFIPGHGDPGLYILMDKIDPQLKGVVFIILSTQDSGVEGQFKVYFGPKKKSLAIYDQINMYKILPQEKIDILGFYLINRKDFLDQDTYSKKDVKHSFSLLVKNLKIYERTFVHEFMHKIDHDRRKTGKFAIVSRVHQDNTRKSKKVKTWLAQSKLYVNDPAELNAHQQAVFFDLDKRKKVFEKNAKFGESVTPLLKWIDDQSNAKEYTYMFVKFLNTQNRKKFLARVYQWWQKNLKGK